LLINNVILVGKVCTYLHATFHIQIVANHLNSLKPMDEKIRKRLYEIKDLSDSRNEKFFSWLKNLITISVGLLGILVSLNSDKIEDLKTSIAFIITISTLALGILSGVVLLYSEMHLLHKARLKKEEQLQNILDGKRKNNVEWIKRDWFFDLSEKVCFVSYLISLISIVIYSILSVL